MVNASPSPLVVPLMILNETSKLHSKQGKRELKYLNKNRIGLIPPPRSSSSLSLKEKKWSKEKKKAKWPKIKPKKDLQINRLKDTHLFTVPNFFTSVESKGFVKVGELMGFAHQGSLGPTKGEAFRDNDRISVNDPVLAETIWESGLNKFFSDIRIRGRAAVGLNPNIRFYRYKVGQRFGRHIDESVDMGDGKRTYYTLLIYLSGGVRQKTKADVTSQKDSPVDSLVGGETVFYDSRRGVVA